MPPHDDAEPRPSEVPPPKRNAAGTQKRILDAAEQEFAIRGFAGARLREIAVNAQVQPALIHHYFNDKQGLYEAVIRRGIDQMSVAGWRVLEHEKDLDGLLRGFVEVILDFYESNQSLLAIMRNEAHTGSDIFVAVAREKTTPILEAVMAICEQLQRDGEIRKDLSPREVLLAGLSLTLYPIVDAPIIQAVLPDPNPTATAERRKRVIAEMMSRAVRPEVPAKRTAAPEKKPKKRG